MSRQLSSREKSLWRIVDEVLYYLWDPIGVVGISQAREEYSSYVPQVFALVRKGVGRDEIAYCLVEIEEKSITLGKGFEGALAVADTLIDHWSWIRETEAS